LASMLVSSPTLIKPRLLAVVKGLWYDYGMGWFVYLVRCRDGSLYCGATKGLHSRIEKHNMGKGARYTRSRRPVRLAYAERVEDRSSALRREWEIKQMSKRKKEELASKRVGGSLDSFLEEEGIKEEVDARAREKVNSLRGCFHVFRVQIVPDPKFYDCGSCRGHEEVFLDEVPTVADVIREIRRRDKDLEAGIKRLLGRKGLGPLHKKMTAASISLLRRHGVPLPRDWADVSTISRVEKDGRISLSRIQVGMTRG